MRETTYPIDGPWRGELAILPRPRGGDWLEDEVREWKRRGIGIVVSLLTAEEWIDLGLEEEPRLCRAHGIEFRPFPIPDRGVPASMAAYPSFVEEIREALEGGKHVGVHCRQGIGRSALVTACLLVVAGVDSESALRTVAEARKAPVPEIPEQREWVETFALHVASTAAHTKTG